MAFSSVPSERFVLIFYCLQLVVVISEVHQRCLLMWIDLKTKTSKTGKIACPQCKMEYTIFFPPSNVLVNVLDKLDVAMFRCCPFLAGGIIVLMTYWTAITYGTLVMIQVLGPEGAREELENIPRSVLLLTLPSLPVLLLGFNAFQWEDRLLKCLRKFGPRVPFFSRFLPAPVVNQMGVAYSPQVGEEMTCTRLIVTSLLTPGVASVIGNVLFKSTVESPIKKALLGFLVMNMFHGVVAMYHKQMMYKKYKYRRVLDYIPRPEDQTSPRPVTVNPQQNTVV